MQSKDEIVKEYVTLMKEFLTERPKSEICFDEFSYNRVITEMLEGIEEFEKRYNADAK